MIRFLLIISVLATSLFAFVPSASVSAQSTSLTITESQINSSRGITNPNRRDIKNIYVDLQPGQIVITADQTLRNGTVVKLAGTFVPVLTNNGTRTRVDFNATSLTVNGKPAGAEYVAARNAFASALGNSVSNSLGRTANVTNVTITNDAMTVTWTR